MTDAYIGLHSRADLGFSFDDYFGSDTTFGLGYVYNSTNNDDSGQGGYGTAPPAYAYDILQGPLVESISDTAILFDGVRPGFREQGMTSFIGYDSEYYAPFIPEDYYNLMQAIWKDGSPLTFGGHGDRWWLTPTKFMYPGNPATKEGWTRYYCDGDDCRYNNQVSIILGSGPFRLAAGDEQDVFYSISWARGEDNLDSYTKTVVAARKVQALFDTGLRYSPEPETEAIEESNDLAWSTVYPNPTSGLTTIEYSLPVGANVLAEVYSSSGRRVSVLENGTRSEGGGTSCR